MVIFTSSHRGSNPRLSTSEFPLAVYMNKKFDSAILKNLSVKQVV